jgi:hypothetical protein
MFVSHDWFWTEGGEKHLGLSSCFWTKSSGLCEMRRGRERESGRDLYMRGLREQTSDEDLRNVTWPSVKWR